MSSFKRSYSFLFIAFSTAFLFSNITALPIESDNPYNKFIDFLMKNNCTMPDVELPFSPTSAESQSNFNYLSKPLKECQTPSAGNETEESVLLCSEIFDVLANISCAEYNIQLPKINVPLSQDICSDFKSMKSIFPKEGDFLSGKLVDGTLCKLLCSKEYKPLCKTVLWSYGVQAKIRSFLENSVKLNDKSGVDKNGTSKPGTASIKVHLTEGILNSSKLIINEIAGNNNAKDTVAEGKETLLDVSNLDNVKSSTVDASSISGQTASSKTVNLINSTLSETSTGTSSLTKGPKVPVVPKIEPESSDETISNNNGIQSVESNPNHQPEQNAVNVDSNSNGVKGIDSTPVRADAKVNSLTPDLSSVTEKNGKITPLSRFPDKENPSVVSDGTDPETSINSNSFVPENNGMDNELNNVDLGGDEKELKVKQPNVQTNDKNKETEKPKLTDFETPLDSDVDLKQLESTTLQILPDRDEDVEHQEDKEQEQYNDTENEGDYPKEYENSFNPPLKNKESSVKSSAIEGSNQLSSSYDILVSSRNNIGRIPDDSRIISAFPEQEDSHFFFYFLSIVLILMAGYLIFHNKQKIIALIVEGRHERRRRSHGAGYKKLETK